jgi:hypothetical protein
MRVGLRSPAACLDRRDLADRDQRLVHRRVVAGDELQLVVLDAAAALAPRRWLGGVVDRELALDSVEREPSLGDAVDVPTSDATEVRAGALDVVVEVVKAERDVVEPPAPVRHRIDCRIPP